MAKWYGKRKTKTARGKVIANGVKVARNKSAPRLNVACAQKMNMRTNRLHTHTNIHIRYICHNILPTYIVYAYLLRTYLKKKNIGYILPT